VDFNVAKTAFLRFLSLLGEVIPIFLLVFILMFLMNLFLDEKKMARVLGKSSGVKGWVISVVGGVLSMGPVYMWYPLLSDLREKGMENSFVATFLYNRAIKLPLLPMMVFYFGTPFTVIVTVYMIIFSIINGVLINKFIK